MGHVARADQRQFVNEMAPHDLQNGFAAGLNWVSGLAILFPEIELRLRPSTTKVAGKVSTNAFGTG